MEKPRRFGPEVWERAVRPANALPWYFRSIGQAVWHELTHLVGYVDGHGGLYRGHGHPIFCGVPLNAAVCTK